MPAQMLLILNPKPYAHDVGRGSPHDMHAHLTREAQPQIRTPSQQEPPFIWGADKRLAEDVSSPLSWNQDLDSSSLGCRVGVSCSKSDPVKSIRGFRFGVPCLWWSVAIQNPKPQTPKSQKGGCRMLGLELGNRPIVAARSNGGRPFLFFLSVGRLPAQRLF